MAPQRSIARSVLMGVVGVANCVIYKGGGGTGTSMTDPYGDGWISMGNSSAGTPMTGPYGDGWVSMGNTSAAAAAPNNAGDTMLLQLANWSAWEDGTGEGSTDGGPFNVKTMVKHLFTAGNHLLVPMEVQTNRRMQRILRHVMAEVYEDMGLQRRKGLCCVCDGVRRLEGDSKKTTGASCENLKQKNGTTCTPCKYMDRTKDKEAGNILKKYELEAEKKKKAEDELEAARKKEEEDDRKKKQQALKEEEDRLNRLKEEEKDLEDKKRNLMLKMIKDGVKNGVDKHQDLLKYRREEINKKLQALKTKEAETKVEIAEGKKVIVEDENKALKKKVKVLEEDRCMKMKPNPVPPRLAKDNEDFEGRYNEHAKYFKSKDKTQQEFGRKLLLNDLAVVSHWNANQDCKYTGKKYTGSNKDTEVKESTQLVQYWQCRTCPSDSKECRKMFKNMFPECLPENK